MEDVATPTYSMKNCLQRALIGNHSNCIVWPLEAILKETVILKRRNLITIALSRAPNVMPYCSTYYTIPNVWVRFWVLAVILEKNKISA